MSALKLVIRDAEHLLHSGELTGPLELGRQRNEEPTPSAAVPCPIIPGSPARLLLPPIAEPFSIAALFTLPPLSLPMRSSRITAGAFPAWMVQ